MDIVAKLARHARERAGEVVFSWLGGKLAPYIPARHSITISQSHFQGDPDQTAPFVQINEPQRDGLGSKAQVGGGARSSSA